VLDPEFKPEKHIGLICEDYANLFKSTLIELQLIHAYCFFITLYRELYDVNMSTFGQIMKGAEVIAVIIYFMYMFICMDHVFTWKVSDGKLELIMDSLSKRNK